MKAKQISSYSLLFLIAAALFICLQSCKKGLLILLPTEYDAVYDKDGRVYDFQYEAKPKFLIYQDLANLMIDLKELGGPSFDSTMRANPDWQFLFIHQGTLADTTQIMKFLNYNKCSIPVIIDEKDSFLKINDFPHYTMWNCYMTSDNRDVEGWMYGGEPFEVQFARAKEKLKKYEK
jgi:hypothetical protein